MTRQPTERKMVEERIKEFNRHQRRAWFKEDRVPVLIPIDVATRILKLAEITSVNKVLDKICGFGKDLFMLEKVTRSNDTVLRKVKEGEIAKRDVFSVILNSFNAAGLCEGKPIANVYIPDIMDRGISRMAPKVHAPANWEDQI